MALKIYFKPGPHGEVNPPFVYSGPPMRRIENGVWEGFELLYEESKGKVIYKYNAGQSDLVDFIISSIKVQNAVYKIGDVVNVYGSDLNALEKFFDRNSLTK